jgi:lipase chaperone LimK
MPRRPASLAGTRPDGSLEVDPQGHFRPSARTRELFDYFLSAQGEEPPETIRARIVAAIDRRLPAAAAADAVALLDRYLAYRERARERAGDGLDTAPPEVRLEAIARLRREVLGAADAEALFGDEEARDRVALARRRALADPTLAPDERARRLAEADAALPESMRRAAEAATRPMRLAADEAALRASGASDDEIQRLRTERVGSEAAARLAALDRERAEWQARLDAYHAARAAIDADPGRSEADRARAREALLAERFSATERLRVQALDDPDAP